MNQSAWRIEKHGGLEVLQKKQIPLASLEPMQIRVKVEAVSLNHLDLWVRKGVPGHRFPLPITPGCDIAGVIDEFGPGAEAASAKENLKIGTPVIVSPGLSCGHCEYCLEGNDPLCAQYGILGETCDGGCADFVQVPLANIIVRPKAMSAQTASALLIPYLTAWSMLIRKAGLQAGETILVHAGGSGVSMAAIQIAKMMGAEVITTVGSPDKMAKAKKLGADHVINYKAGPFREELKKLGKRVSLVVDHVGADTMADSIKSLSRGGRLVTCGATTGSDVTIDMKQIFFKNISILGTTMGSKGDMIEIIRMAAAGKFAPVIDSTFPMADLPKAHARLESREAFGKIVVTQ